jgi:hypothetical protein
LAEEREGGQGGVRLEACTILKTIGTKDLAGLRAAQQDEKIAFGAASFVFLTNRLAQGFP